MNVIEAAKAAGFRTGQIHLTEGDPIPFAAAISATGCLHELERFAQIIRNQALEDAAAECDGVYYQHLGPEYGEVRYGIAACSSAIRALKGAKE